MICANKNNREIEMTNINTLFRNILHVNTAKFTKARFEVDSKGQYHLYVYGVVHRKHDNCCPICGKKGKPYDRRENVTRSWRCMDFGGLIVHIESDAKRIECPEHGILSPAVPWAYSGSRFTKDFDRSVAWLATSLSKSSVAEYMRIDWQTVGRCISRTLDDIEPDIKKRLDGLVNIGIDETSYRKGYKYITVIVNHDTNSVVWLHNGHGKSVLEKFYEELSEEQRASIKVVTGDGARWITDCVKQYTPDCVRCMDSFHVVEWAMTALDDVRKESWHDANDIVKAIEKGYKASRGRPRADDREAKKLKKAKDCASAVKGSSFAVGKAPEHLTKNQQTTLEGIRKSNSRLYRAYEMKETLRLILKSDNVDEAENALKSWFYWATHSRIDAFKELAKKVKRNMPFILNTIRIGLSNARIESTNNRIKLIIRRSFGFRNLDSMFSMIYLVCSDLIIPLPNRPNPLSNVA